MPLGLPRLTEVLDGPQTSQGGIEESEQMGDDNIIEKEPPVAVRVGLPQGLRIFFQHSDVLAASDLLRPIWQRIDVVFFAHARIVRDLGQGRKMGI
jgi:hypothetical protein